MQATGICMGASNIKLAKIRKNNGSIICEGYEVSPHEGNVKRVLRKLLKKHEFSPGGKLAVTGRKFKDQVNLPSISEPAATEYAYDFVKNKYGEVEAIISAGGETFMVYELDDNGKIINVYTGNKCASGTGEFFFQQIKRMGLDLDTATNLALTDNPYRVSGRCSVFCKSDCTHALNKGEEKGRIVAGLCEMMVDKIIELLNKCAASNVMLVGGTANNEIMLEYLRQRVKRLVVPDEAEYFEALGTAIWARDKGDILHTNNIFVEDENSFDFLPALADYRDLVTFHEMEKGQPRNGDRCLLGLDVGSTTTKAVIIREDDNTLLASVYLRTEGDPIQAARNCYRDLIPQLNNKKIDIIGLGVTGSGRQIAGLHALTNSIINEIIAHAAGAVNFDPDVDTIFEIGGQDAKYTYLVNQVPTDYAMNEACSAGTGSFLEEAAGETLNIAMEDIEGIALQGESPPNFSDQCSAFISSDIKNAIQEGIGIEDISAGLVYSICLNYTNRVKENRPVGKKVFMQGGVCYNKAVPVAMAALTGKEIIVPPEPGLMGAYGVALVVKEHLKLGLVEEKSFDLKELAGRDVNYLKPFTCSGGSENCDRKCKINVLEIEGEKYPFGGICNKYYNINQDLNYDVEKLDLVKKREKMVFEDFYVQPDNNVKGKIGLNRSLVVNSLLPLFSGFFAQLGYEIVLPEEITESGKQRQSAAFCYPVEISHGYMDDLLTRDTDYLFLPHIKGLYTDEEVENSVLCPLAQGEPYYLRATWPEIKKRKVFSPVLDFKDGYRKVKDEFLAIGKRLGEDSSEINRAFTKAVTNQENFEQRLKQFGQQALAELEADSDKKAVVLFGRPYNAFSSEANMGIPHKFASRGELVIPYDMLPLQKYKVNNKMYWSMGQLIMKGAQYVSEHPQLFGAYITNFSCGPDSFLVNYFRRENGRKPTLTLELDSHTADAGLDTRVEAFLDVVESYLQLQKEEVGLENKHEYNPARIDYDSSSLQVIDSRGNRYSLSDERVKLLVPSMGGLLTRSFISALRYNGFNALACPQPGKNELKSGRASCSGKECLPLQLTLGSLINYLEQRSNDNELLVYFMPEASGPCRFGQYNVLMNNYLEDNQIEDVALLTLTASNNYAGLGNSFTIRAWQAVVVGDTLTQIHNTILALARNKERAIKIFNRSKKHIFHSLENHSWLRVKQVLKKEADRLASISLTQPYEEAQKVALTGEIYVRSDKFSRQHLVKKLARKNIVTHLAPAAEWLYYIDFLVQNDLVVPEPDFKQKIKNKIKGTVQRHLEKKIKKIFARTGLCEGNSINIEEIIAGAQGLISKKLTGEAILTIGGAVSEIIDEVDGVIAIGPFGCMPHRIAESIISNSMEEQKGRLVDDNSYSSNILSKFQSLPFLAIETDGNVFPQVIEARLEAFCLQVKRINAYKNALKDQDELITGTE